MIELLPGLDYEAPDILIVQGFEGADTVTHDEPDMAARTETPFALSEGSKIVGCKAKVRITALIIFVLSRFNVLFNVLLS